MSWSTSNWRSIDTQPKTSLNDKYFTIDGYRKDSFDRYGDDLCQLIVSHLQLMDSFRMQCVSKQWARNVFIGHNTLDINEWFQQWIQNGGQRVESIRYRVIDSVVKRCLNITSIKVTIDSQKSWILLQIVLNEWNDMSSISVVFNANTTKELIREVITKYGHRLTAIDILEYKTWAELKFTSKPLGFMSVPALRRLSTSQMKNIFTGDELLVTTLDHFGLQVKPYPGYLTHWQTFSHHYSHSLKSLTIELIYQSPQLTHKVLDIIGSFVSLRKLHTKVLLDTMRFGNRFMARLNHLTDTCGQLRELHLNLNGLKMNDMFMVFMAMSRFTNLRDLNVVVKCMIVKSSGDVSLGLLSPLKLLTHLSLDLKDYFMGDEFFESIDTHLPQLSCLEIAGQVEVTRCIKRAVKSLPELEEWYLNYHRMD